MKTPNNTVIRTLCPACDRFFTIEADRQLNSKVRCPLCNSDLIVAQIDPIVLDWDDFEQDDWDDTDDDLDY